MPFQQADRGENSAGPGSRALGSQCDLAYINPASGFNQRLVENWAVANHVGGH